jgi:hypothetical protein
MRPLIPTDGLYRSRQYAERADPVQPPPGNGIDLRLKRALIELQGAPVLVRVPYGVASEWDLGEIK